MAIDTSLLARYPHELSGGQQQRVALARALAPQPCVILLDEPFSAFDTALRAQTRQAVIDALQQSAVTTILVTHDQEEALSFGEQIAIIPEGRIVQAGAPISVFDNPVSAEAAIFLGDAIFVACKVREGRAHTALGVHHVSHDHSVGSRGAAALVRPGQLSLSFDGEEAYARIVETRYIGSRLDVTLAVGQGAEVLRALFTAEDPREYRPGRRVQVVVSGGVVVYAA